MEVYNIEYNTMVRDDIEGKTRYNKRSFEKIIKCFEIIGLRFPQGLRIHPGNKDGKPICSKLAGRLYRVNNFATRSMHGESMSRNEVIKLLKAIHFVIRVYQDVEVGNNDINRQPAAT